MFQPLEGVRVIDLSQVLAGPYATYQMALMGAEVIKIEQPGEGDWTRVGGAVPELSECRMGLGFLAHNAGKKSVTINLKSPEGLEIARTLLAGADVFVENFKPGVAERLGLGFEAVRGINPKIVYCSISAYGQDGPLSGRPAYDHVIQGMCGIMLTTGKPGDGPTKVGAPYIDYATGMNAAMAALAGLREVERTGEAVHIDVAMLDTALMLMASLMSQHLSAGWMPVQNGNEAWSASPSSGAFDTADGLLMLAANNDAQFRNLCRAIGRDDILQDPRWRIVPERSENSDSLRETLEETFRTNTAAHWEDVLDKAAVPAARVRGLDEVLAEPQVRARGLTSEIRVDGHDGAIHIPTMSFKANGENTPPRTPPAPLGADTDEVLLSAGIDAERIAALRAAGVI
jgi:crotonobetainyl-CoA:carnitine CoA-transferase CaiB-like acyl-CoA transferase